MTAILSFFLALVVLMVSAVVCCLPIYLLQLYCVRHKTMTPMIVVVGTLFILAALRMMG